MRRVLPFIAVAAVSALVAVLAVVLIGGGDDSSSSSASATPATAKKKPKPVLTDGLVLKAADGSYSLRYPKTWKQLTAEQAGLAPGAQTPVIERTDKGGRMLIQTAGKLDGTLQKLSSALTKKLEKQVGGGFSLVGSSEVTLAGGKALSYTFVEKKNGAVHNLTVIPHGQRTYTLNSLLNGSSQQAARDVAQIVQTFKPEN